MKNCIIAGLVLTQCFLSAQPAAAADFDQLTSAQSGTFTGARIRFSLGGQKQDQKFRAGLMFAPSLRSHSMSGTTRMRIGEGLEFGFVGKRPLTFSLAGRPVASLLAGGRKPDDDQRLGASTGKKIAIGAGVIALAAGAIVLGVVISQSNDAPDES